MICRSIKLLLLISVIKCHLSTAGRLSRNLTEVSYPRKDYKLQSCNVTGEPFQVTYSEDCGRACFQVCDAAPDLSQHCVVLPKYCEGFPATCGGSGCECIHSSRLLGNTYSLGSLQDHMMERIICEASEIEVRISKCAANELGLKLNDFYINGPATTSHIPSVYDVTLQTDSVNTCRGRMQISEMGLHYVFRVARSLKACNGQAKVDMATNQVTFANAIRAITRHEHQRHAIHVMFSCTFVLEADSNQVNASLRPVAHDVKIYSGHQKEDFNLTLALWEDLWHESYHVFSNAIKSEENIYILIGARILNGTRYNIQVLQATVTSSEDMNDRISIPLITDGCVEGDDNPHGVTILNNGNSMTAEFKFQVFQLLRLSAEEEIYVHVVAHLCDEIFEGNCETDCTDRRKNSATISEMNTKNVTSPPIRVLKWHKQINKTGHNITVMEALQYITESWEMTLMITCVLLLILTLMISMCVLLLKISNQSTKNQEGN